MRKGVGFTLGGDGRLGGVPCSSRPSARGGRRSEQVGSTCQRKGEREKIPFQVEALLGQGWIWLGPVRFPRGLLFFCSLLFLFLVF
jgi:hypothetical protein